MPRATQDRACEQLRRILAILDWAEVQVLPFSVEAANYAAPVRTCFRTTRRDLKVLESIGRLERVERGSATVWRAARSKESIAMLARSARGRLQCWF